MRRDLLIIWEEEAHCWYGWSRSLQEEDQLRFEPRKRVSRELIISRAEKKRTQTESQGEYEKKRKKEQQEPLKFALGFFQSLDYYYPSCTGFVGLAKTIITAKKPTRDHAL